MNCQRISLLILGLVLVPGMVTGATTAIAQTSNELASRYGDPDVERFIVRPRVTVTVAYGPDRTGCQMVVQPKRSILKNDSQSDLMAREIVPEVLAEILPESSSESLLRNIEQVVGCDIQVLTTYYNVTINASHEHACRASERGEPNVVIVRKDGLCGAVPTRSDSPSDVSTAQKATDFHTRYGVPDAQRYVVRPGITLMAAYGTDQFACQMVVEPIASMIPSDEPPKYMRPEVVTEILEEVLPEADRGKLLLGVVTKSGCNEYETMDYQNVTISRFRHKCRLPDPEIEGRAAVYRKLLSCVSTD